MTDWKERFVEKALTEESDLHNKLNELAMLDMQVTAPTQTLNLGGRVLRGVNNEEQARLMEDPGWYDKSQRLDQLCDEVAAMVVEPGEQVDEIAQWISYHCQEVEEEINERTRQSYLYNYEMPRKIPIWFLISLVFGVGVFFLSRWYGQVWWQSLLLAIIIIIASFFLQAREWIRDRKL